MALSISEPVASRVLGWGGTLPPWVPLLFSDALPKGKGPPLYLQGYQEDGKEGRRRGQMEGSPVPQGEGQTTQDHLACAVGASQDRHGDRPPAGRGPLHHWKAMEVQGSVVALSPTLPTSQDRRGAEPVTHGASSRSG